MCVVNGIFHAKNHHTAFQSLEFLSLFHVTITLFKGFKGKVDVAQ